MNAETEDASSTESPETFPFWFSFSFIAATVGPLTGTGTDFEFSTAAAYDMYKRA